MPAARKREIHFANRRELSLIASVIESINDTLQLLYEESFHLDLDGKGRIEIFDEEGGVIGAIALEASRGEFVYYGVGA